jgi:hypothetical protein
LGFPTGWSFTTHKETSGAINHVQFFFLPTHLIKGTLPLGKTHSRETNQMSLLFLEKKMKQSM